MRIPKPTEADKAYFQSLVPDDPRVEVKPMSGNLGAFVNGNMFIGLFGVTVGVNLAGDDCRKLLAEPGAGPLGPEERPMIGYVAMPSEWRKAPKKAAPGVALALAHVGTMPPKAKAKKSTKKQ